MLEHYLYVNETLLDEYSAQLGLTERHSLSKLTSKVSVSLAGPKLESNREYSREVPHLKERINQFTEELTARNLLAPARPKESGMWYGNEVPRRLFVLENVTAVKVTFLKKHLEPLPSIHEFAVWIADPDPEHPTLEDWVYRGTFLLLPQLHFDNVRFHSVYSGCSALQAVMNGIEGRPLISGVGGEPLGRDSYDHPLEKLKRLGAILSPRQRIRTLYRMRYITNEQCYTLNGTQYRVNDLLAYPIYIASE